MPDVICPKGHTSTDAEFCSDCGARVIATATPGVAENSSVGEEYPATAYAGEICPDCGSVREKGGTVFCEVCGFNFATGAHGEIPGVDTPDEPREALPEAMPPSAPASQAMPAVQRCRLVLSVEEQGEADPTSAIEPAATPKTIDLQRETNLIGRRDDARGIQPEVAIPWDDAVSRRHALLQRGPDGQWTLRDIGAANGTQLNGAPLPPFEDHPLQDGDVLHLGRRSRIDVQLR